MDLAASQPEKVKELQALYDSWNKEQAPASAVEKPNKNKNKSKKKKAA